MTQVSQDSLSGIGLDGNSNIDFNLRIHLNIRGEHFNITRDELMSLPESILLLLFPNGVFLDIDGQVITNLTEDDVVAVNFDPCCFEYILQVFGDAQRDVEAAGQLLPQVLNLSSRLDSALVLKSKPAIIVLREDLDFYVIPPVAGCTPADVHHLKAFVGQQLMQHKSVFSGLGYNPLLPQATPQPLGAAEQHLFDMLCSLGFSSEEQWGCRAMEPLKCVISSLLLVRLLPPQPTPPDLPGLNPVSSNALGRSRLRLRIALIANSALRAALRSLSRVRQKNDSTQTKLLLFWRKPARKCWWSNQELTVPTEGTHLAAQGPEATIKVHVRRVWTLELSVVGVQ